LLGTQPNDRCPHQRQLTSAQAKLAQGAQPLFYSNAAPPRSYFKSEMYADCVLRGSVAVPAATAAREASGSSTSRLISPRNLNESFIPTA
jgi:hypothetical protein